MLMSTEGKKSYSVNEMQDFFNLLRHSLLCVQVFVFEYPVGERQEADKGCSGRHHLHDHPDSTHRCMTNLHTQQPLLQRFWLWNPLKTSLKGNK